VVQQPPIQLSQLTTCFYWIENCDFALIDILKYNRNSPLEHVVSLFNTSCNTNKIKKENKFFIQYLQLFLKNNTNVPINEILSSYSIMMEKLKYHDLLKKNEKNINI
jgi:hypothetical protein